MAKESANNGRWIKLYAGIRNWEHYTEPNVLLVFLDLLFSATYEPKRWRGVNLKRGQSVITLDTLEEHTQLSRPTIIKALRTLENTGEIKRKKINQKLIVTTICNYSNYQDNTMFCSKADLPQSLPQSLPQDLPNIEYIEYIDKEEEDKKAHTHEKNLLDELLNSQITLEQFCYTERITTDQFKEVADAVAVEWELVGSDLTATNVNKRKFISHMRKKIQAMRDSGQLVNGTKEERKQKFVNECKQLIAEGCPNKDVAEFANYYTQDAKDGRMLFETFRGWSTKNRFLMFAKN